MSSNESFDLGQINIRYLIVFHSDFPNLENRHQKSILSGIAQLFEIGLLSASIFKDKILIQICDYKLLKGFSQFLSHLLCAKRRVAQLKKISVLHWKFVRVNIVKTCRGYGSFNKFRVC